MNLRMLLTQERLKAEKEADVKLRAQASVFKSRINLLKGALRDVLPALEKCNDHISVEDVRFILSQDDVFDRDLEKEENETIGLL